MSPQDLDDIEDYLLRHEWTRDSPWLVAGIRDRFHELRQREKAIRQN